jgi:N-acetylornithine carbamoyltransferase
VSLKGKSFITTLDVAPKALEGILRKAAALKKGRPSRALRGKSVALVFFNPSLRTRVSFEVGIAQLGGTPVTFSPGAQSWSLESREGAVMDGDKTEHVKDAARVLSRYVDAIAVRCFPGMESYEEDMADTMIEAFRKYAEVPVINMESALWHPCQAMADALTIRERFKKVAGTKVTLSWAYHPRMLPTAVSNSFAAVCSQLGAEVTIACPKELVLDPGVMARLPRPPRVVHDLEEGLEGAQVVYAKSWGGPAFYGRWEEERKVREAHRDWMIRRIPKGSIFMHCLPVRRNVVVADDVLDASAVYDQAENRLHVQKAILSEVL